MSPPRPFPTGLPAAAGIGLKPEHYRPLLAALEQGPAGPDGGALPRWVEIHPQNYFGAGGPPHRWLAAIRAELPLSFHSTGLSLGAAAGPDLDDLARIADLAARYQPAAISDHLSWSNAPGHKLPDLLPLPMTAEALDVFAANVSRVQDRLGRPILVENPSRYLAFAGDTLDEIDFLHALCARTGCGLLLDINNVAVSAHNLGFDAADWLARIDPALVGEVHLAGHATEVLADGRALRIDDHGSPVSEECWRLLASFLARSGPVPVLIERDTAIPPFAELAAEAARAGRMLEACDAVLAG